jgi:hypothetical protein
MIAIAVCSTLQIILLTKRVRRSFLSLSATKKCSKRIQPLRVFFAQPPLLLLRQLRVILLRRRSVLPVVPLPHRTRDETEGQPHENFLIHVHALRCERYRTDQSVNNSLSVSHAFLFRVFFRLAVTGRNETHVSSYRPASRVPWTSNTRFRVVDFNFFFDRFLGLGGSPRVGSIPFLYARAHPQITNTRA